jgi:hypothetical protein
MNLPVPWNAGNFLTSWGPVSFSRKTLLLRVRYFVRKTHSRRSTKNSAPFKWSYFAQINVSNIWKRIRAVAILKTGLPSFLPSIPVFVRWWPSCRTSQPSKPTTAYLMPEVAHTWQTGAARDRGEIWSNNRTLQRLPFQENTALGPQQPPPPTLPNLQLLPALLLLLFAPFNMNFTKTEMLPSFRCLPYHSLHRKNNPNVNTNDTKSVALDCKCDHNAHLTNEVRTT